MLLQFMVQRAKLTWGLSSTENRQDGR